MQIIVYYRILSGAAPTNPGCFQAIQQPDYSMFVAKLRMLISSRHRQAPENAELVCCNLQYLQVLSRSAAQNGAIYDICSLSTSQNAATYNVCSLYVTQNLQLLFIL